MQPICVFIGDMTPVKKELQPLARMWHWTTQHWGQSSAVIPASQQDQAFQDLSAHSVTAYGYICNRVINIIEEASVTLSKTEHLSLKINKWMHQLCCLAEGRGIGWEGGHREWKTRARCNCGWRRPEHRGVMLHGDDERTQTGSVGILSSGTTC